MDQQNESTAVLSRDLQNILFSTVFENHAYQDHEVGADLQTITTPSMQQIDEVSLKSTQFLNVDPQSLDRWIPDLRKFIEKDQMDDVIEELDKSIQDNFQDSGLDLYQNTQINDQLMHSIENLSNIQLQLENTRFQKQLSALQHDLAEYTEKVIVHKQRFLKNKKTHSKINETSLLINKILQILELSNNCHQLILSNQFFRALQSLDSLEIIYSQDLKKDFNFDFLSQLYHSIPLFKEIVRDESINLIKKYFNSNLEKSMSKAGNDIFIIYKDEFYKDWLANKSKYHLPASIKFNSSVEISLRDSTKERQLSFSKWFNVEPFHDAILMFASMNQLSYLSTEFSNIYEFWQNKFVYPLEFDSSSAGFQEPIQQNNGPNTQMQKYGIFKTVDNVKEYLFKIVGFLMFDRYLQRETEYTLTQDAFTITENFWNKFCKTFIPYLKYFISKQLVIEDEKSLNSMNEVLGIFISIFSFLKLDIKSFNTCHLLLFEKFTLYQKEYVSEEFTELLKDDDFMPLSIEDKKLYTKILKLCWLKDSDREVLNDSLLELPDSEFSVSLPFSPLYPMTCSLLKNSESKIQKYVAEFYPSQTNVTCEKIISTIDSIFNDVIIAQFKAKLGSKFREELSQIMINLDYFYIATKEMGVILSERTGQDVQLTAVNKMRDIRNLAESRLIELIDSKVSDLLEIADLDWTAQTVRNEPDLIITDIAQYLEMMFTSTLVNLPYQMKTLLIFREFDALTSRFLNILIHNTPPTITPQSVLNFETDMKCLENVITLIFGSTPSSGDEDTSSLSQPSRESSIPFGARSPSMYFSASLTSSLMESNVRSLVSTFDDLKQHINLLKSGSLDQYIDNRMKVFPRVKPENANLLINKLSTYQQMLREKEQETMSNSLDGSNHSSSTLRNNSPTDDDTKSLMSTKNKKKLAKFFGRK